MNFNACTRVVAIHGFKTVLFGLFVQTGLRSASGQLSSACADYESTFRHIETACCAGSTCDDVPTSCSGSCAFVFADFWSRCGEDLDEAQVIDMDQKVKFDNLHYECTSARDCMDDETWVEQSGRFTCGQYAMGEDMHSRCLTGTTGKTNYKDDPNGPDVPAVEACPLACHGMCTSDYLQASTDGVERSHDLTLFPDMGGTRAQWFTFTVDETASYHISAKGHCNAKNERVLCLYVYMQLFEKNGKNLLEEVDSSTVGPEHPVASIPNKELGAGTYSILIYSPSGSPEATLQIRRVDDSEISGMATQLFIDNAVMIRTSCDTSNCQHSVNQGQEETYPILSFSGKAGRTYNFTTESILGSDADAVNGVRLAAHIMPSTARDGHQVWDSAENRIESIMGEWRAIGRRPLKAPSETDSFKMYFDQHEDITKRFSWVCPGDGEYYVRFIGINCAVPAYAENGPDNSCTSQVQLTMAHCVTCNVRTYIELEVELQLPTVMLQEDQQLEVEPQLPSVTVATPALPELYLTSKQDEEVQAQLAQMFQHETLPVLAFPTSITSITPIDRDTGGKRRLQHGPKAVRARVRVEVRAADGHSADDVRKRLLNAQDGRTSGCERDVQGEAGEDACHRVTSVRDVTSKSASYGNSGRRLMAARVDVGLAAPSSTAEAPLLADVNARLAGENARLAGENARLLVEVAALQRELEAHRGSE